MINFSEIIRLPDRIRIETKTETKIFSKSEMISREDISVTFSKQGRPLSISLKADTSALRFIDLIRKSLIKSRRRI